MIDYIGDISKADAKVLHEWGLDSHNILEFGCGASTQVLVESLSDYGKLTSVDTDANWIEKTVAHIKRQDNLEKNIKFYDYDTYWQEKPEGPVYDFVFDDGVDHLRRQFGLRIWPNIKIGGWLALHDQRRRHDWDNTIAIIDTYWLEVGTVHFNHNHSNITLIQKKESEPYSNWQIDEKIDMSKW